jgi:hypothetical protein
MQNVTSFLARETNIQDVLFAHCAYRVPRYQRPYAWDDDQVTEFWNDLIVEGGSAFLGSLIFNSEDVDKTGRIDIIDGQQRLLTITILTAALRDVANSLDHTRAQLIQRTDIATEDRITGNLIYRIIPGDQTKSYFEKYVQGFPSDISESQPLNLEQRRIKNNYLFFREKVEEELKRFVNKNDKIDYLSKLRAKIGNLTAIKIQINNEDEAYEIFETTNARGVDLSVGDLLKNLIFKKLPPTEDKDFARDRWQDIMDLVDATSTEFRRFIRYYWISRHTSTTERRLFREIKRETADYNQLLDDIWDSAALYNMLLEGAEKDWSRYKHGSRMYSSARALRIMNVSQCHVLFLAILRNIDKIDTDPSRIFELLEKFSFKYHVVCKWPSNRVEKMYARYAKAIEYAVTQARPKHVSGKVQSLFSDLEGELREIAPQKDYFVSQFNDIVCTNTEQSRRIVKYILGRIDASLRKTKEEAIDFDNVNLEHLLPQKPGKGWGLKSKEIKEYVNKLGNLTLLDKRINSIAGNKTMREKADILSGSALPLNADLLGDIRSHSYKWDEDSIAKRQDKLAEIAWDPVWRF